ncbi:MAG: class II glutamine amidotransferase [Rhodospirillaceae bacterium]|nr:class II glutamine amidotransferase [Rhodospirillaceae bacterium]
MCRWLTYCGEPIYLDKVLFEPKNSLISQSLRARHSHVTTNGDGFGIGWYGERPQPGVYRDILPAWNDQNLKSLAHQIRSGLFLAHVRASTGTATSRANCHPFAHGKWLFMHNGQVGGYERIRRRLEAMIDDKYYCARVGTTDSELIFYLLFSEGLEQDPMRALTRSVGKIEQLAQAEGINEPFKFTAVLSDGETIYAIRHSSSDVPPTLYHVRRGDHVMVVSEPLDDDNDESCFAWREVPPSQMLVIEKSGKLDMVPFLAAA